MQLKFKKLDEKAVMPIRAHKGDAGLDLTSIGVSTTINECGQLMLVYHTGLAVEIPEGYVGLLFPRSSIYKKALTLTNAVGVIDAGYRGEIQAVFRSTTDVVPAIYKDGERFAQLVIIQIPEFDPVEVDELSETDRGADGLGSTGNKEISAAIESESQDVPPTDKGEAIIEDEQTTVEQAAERVDGSETVA